MWTRWDAYALARAAGFAAFALLVGWLLTAATDEGSVPWVERIGRTLPLTPVCAAVGVWGALAPVRARGEALALEALGRTRGQVGMGAVAGGSALAVAAALAILFNPALSVDGFYPTVTHTVSWQWQDGGFVDLAHGVRILRDGAPVRVPSAAVTSPLPSVPPYGRLAAALSMALTGAAMAMLLAHALLVRRPAPWRGAQLRRSGVIALGVVGAAAIATVVLFQAAAVRRVPALAGVSPSAGLLVLAIWRYRRSQ